MVQVLTCLVYLADYEGKTRPERGSDLPEVTQQLCSQDQLANIYWEHLLSARPFTKFLRWVSFSPYSNFIPYDILATLV